MQAVGDIKVCSRCQDPLPLDSFNKNRAAKDGLGNYCKVCHADANRQLNHGVTPEQYLTMKVAQDNKCAICKSEVKLYVDHCHQSETLRGLLCQKCNALLGMCNDNLEVLQNAIGYLKRYLG